MKAALLGVMALVALEGSASGQGMKVYKWDGAVTIPDATSNTAPNTQFASVFIDVPAQPPGLYVIPDLDVDLVIAHSWQGDLRIDLIAPGGQMVNLMNRPGTTSAFGSPFGFSTDNLGNPISGAKFFFDDEAASVYDTGGVGVGTGLNNPTGSWKPENPLSILDGTDKSGRWELRVTDLSVGDIGIIHNFSLHFPKIPAPGTPLAMALLGLCAARRSRH